MPKPVSQKSDWFRGRLALVNITRPDLPSDSLVISAIAQRATDPHIFGLSRCDVGLDDTSSPVQHLDWVAGIWVGREGDSFGS